MPKEWYEQFKAIVNGMLGADKTAGSILGVDGRPLLDFDTVIKGTKLTELSEAQAGILYEAAKTGGLIIPAENKADSQVIYNDKDNKPAIIAPNLNIVNDNNQNKEEADKWQKPLKDAIEKFSKLDDSEIVSEEKIRDYSIAAKTMTDLYGGPDAEKVLDAEWVLDANGNPLKKGKDVWASYGTIDSALKGEAEVYFQGIYNKETGKEESYKFHKNPETNRPEKTLQEVPMVSGAVKNDVIKEFEPIADALALHKTKNPFLNRIKNNINKTIEDLNEITGKEEFNKKLEELAHDADMYFMVKSGTKLSKTGANKLEMVSRIREIRDASMRDKHPSQLPQDKVKFMQTQLAAKFVKGYAVSMRNYSKDPVLADKAKAMLLDHKAFEKGVNEIMANPAFQYLYGSRKEGDSLDTIKRINEGMDLKASQLVKNVKVEAELPSKDRPAFESYMKQQAPKRIDATRGINGRLALSRHAEILDALEDMRKQLTAVGRSGAASAELQNLEKELAISTLRLQNGNNFMNVKAQLAQLGDAADTYMNKVMNSKMNNRRFQRFNIANQIKEVCDAVAEDKPIAENVKHGDELKKDSLATRLANQVAKELLKSDSPAAQKRGKRMLLEPKIFEAEKEKLMDSEAFQNLYNKSGAIEDAIESKPESVYKDFLAEKKRTEPEIVKNGPDRKKLEEKALEKEQEEKTISLSF